MVFVDMMLGGLSIDRNLFCFAQQPFKNEAEAGEFWIFNMLIYWWNAPGWTYMRGTCTVEFGLSKPLLDYQRLWVVMVLTMIYDVFRYRDHLWPMVRRCFPQERNLPSLWWVDSTTGTALRGVDLFRFFAQKGWTNGQPVDQKIWMISYGCPFWDLYEQWRLDESICGQKNWFPDFSGCNNYHE